MSSATCLNVLISHHQANFVKVYSLCLSIKTQNFKEYVVQHTLSIMDLKTDKIFFIL